MYCTRSCEEIRRIQKGVWVEGKSVGFGRSGVHEGRDRVEVGSGKGEFVSHHGGIVMEEELEVEDRISAGMGLEGRSGRCFAFYSHVSRKGNA